MLTQYELIMDGLTGSAPRNTRTLLKEDFAQEKERATITLVMLANAARDDENIFVQDRGREIPYRVYEYKIPDGFNWTSVVHFSPRIAKNSNLARAGKFCVTTSRPSFSAAQKEDGLYLKSVMSPAEFSMFWDKIAVSDRNININCVPISKVDHVLDDVEGLYDLGADVALANMVTTNIGATTIPVMISEFFKLTSTKDLSDESFKVFPPTDAEFLAWMGSPQKAPVPKHNDGNDNNSGGKTANTKGVKTGSKPQNAPSEAKLKNKGENKPNLDDGLPTNEDNKNND
jgi:hypothetical protein